MFRKLFVGLPKLSFLVVLVATTVWGSGHAAALDRKPRSFVFSDTGTGGALAWSTDGRTLATGGYAVKLWDPRSGKDVSGPFEPELTRYQSREAYYLFVHSLAFAPKGNVLATACRVKNTVHREDDKTLKLFDLADGKEARGLRWGGRDVQDVAWTKDGSGIVAVSLNNGAVLWKVKTRKKIWAVKVSGHALALSPDFKQVAIASRKSQVRILDMATGKELRALQGNAQTSVMAVAWSPDGKTICAVVGGTELVLWDAGSGKAMRDAQIFPKQVHTLAFSGNSKVLAIGDAEGRLRLIDVASGRILDEVAAHEGALWTVAYSPNGKTLATAGGDGKVKLWRGADR